MPKKFIRGTFELEQNVTDLEAFEHPKMPKLMEIIEWAKKNGVAMTDPLKEVFYGVSKG